MARPALQRLLANTCAGRVDIVIVYKIDRLTRSLADFCQERRDPRYQGRVACVDHAAVQHDDVDGALDPQCAFAQFEREIIGERIRDKIAAAKKKGMWMGGVLPLGYRVADRKLVIVDSEVEIRVRRGSGAP